MRNSEPLASCLGGLSGQRRLVRNIVAFATLFSILFFILHATSLAKVVLSDDLDDLGGLPWLYSAVCLIFSILAGFVIQHEWGQWNDFMNAIKGEVGTVVSDEKILRRLCLVHDGEQW